MSEKNMCTVAWPQAGFHDKNNTKISVTLIPNTIFKNNIKTCMSNHSLTSLTTHESQRKVF